MKASQVRVERTKNNETIGITIDLVDGATAEDAIRAGRGFLGAQFGEVASPEELAECQRKLDAANYVKL